MKKVESEDSAAYDTISRFIGEVVPVAQRVAGDGGVSTSRMVAADSLTTHSCPSIVSGFTSII